MRKSPKLVRDLRLLLVVGGLGMSNVQLPFIILFYIHDLHARPAFALQVFAACGLLGGLLEIPTGWFADRYGRKRSISIGNVMVVGAFALYATSQYIGPKLILGAILAYTGWTLTHGADSAWASDICDDVYSDKPGPEGKPSERDRAFIHFTTTGTRINGLSQAFGCVAGAVLAWKFGLRSVMWGQMVAYVPMVFITLRVTEPKFNRQVPKITATVASLLHRSRLIAVIMVAAVLSLGINLAVKLVPLYFVSIKFGSDLLKTQDLGYYWPFFFAAAYFVRPSFADSWRARLGWYRSLAILLVIATCCYVILAATTSIPGLGVASVLSAIIPMHRGGTTQRIRELSEQHERATIMSIHRTVGWILTAIVGIIVAAAIGAVGLSAGMLIAGCIIGVLGALALGAMMLADRRIETRHRADPSFVSTAES